MIAAERCTKVPDRALIVDIDGTLADSAWRNSWAQAGEWDEFHERSIEDSPRRDVADLIIHMVPINWDVIICTGRPSNYRRLTLDWLDKHDLSPFVDELLMRPAYDYRPDAEVKRELVERHFGGWEVAQERVAFVLEDRDKVCDMWRNHGLVCWQVQPGGY